MNRSRGVLVVAVVAGMMLAFGWTGSAVAGAANRSSLIVVDSVVQGSTNAPRERVCVLNSRYQHGEQIVWRIKVIDPVTGEMMDDKQLERVWVELVDGQVFEAKYGPHPRTNPTDYFWATSWVIPPDYPSGVLDYTIYAQSKDGRTGSNVKFEVESSMVVILPGSATR